MKYLDFLIKYDKTVLEESRKLDDVNKKLRNSYLKLLGESCCEDGEEGCQESCCNEEGEEPKQQFDEGKKKKTEEEPVEEPAPTPPAPPADDEGGEAPKRKAKDGMLDKNEFYGEAPAAEPPAEEENADVKTEAKNALGNFFDLDPETEKQIETELADPDRGEGSLGEAEETAAQNSAMDASGIFNEGEGCGKGGCSDGAKEDETDETPPANTEVVTEKDKNLSKDDEKAIASMWGLNEEEETEGPEDPTPLQESIAAVTQFVKASRKPKKRTKKS